MSSTAQSGAQLIEGMRSNASNTVGRQGSFKKLISSVVNNSANSTNAAAEAAAKAAAEAAAKAAAEAAAKAAAEAAKAALRLQVEAGIAEAEKQYAAELKAAQDKLSAAKASWMAKLNG
jgi:membrane protein involved in colicin uptake